MNDYRGYIWVCWVCCYWYRVQEKKRLGLLTPYWYLRNEISLRCRVSQLTTADGFGHDITAKRIVRQLLALYVAKMMAIIYIIIIIISFSSLPAAATHCAPRCSCRHKPPTSFLVMDCSSVVTVPIADLNMVNFSSSVSDLDLSNNSFSSVPASSFYRFVALETLNLRSNRLAFVGAGAFDGSQLRRYHFCLNFCIFYT